MSTTTSALSTDTVAGYFSDETTAHSALHALEQAGFAPSQIGYASRGSASDSQQEHSESQHTSASTKEPGIWDKVKNFFDGGKEAEPYAGEATGDSMNDREVTSGEYEPDDMHHSLKGLSVADEHSRYFGHRFGQAEGGALVTVAAGGRAEEVRAILKQHGADLGEEAADYAYPEQTEDLGSSVSGQRNIRLYGEVLRVQKERVSSGEVRIRKEVFTETQTIEVPTLREELVIERVAVPGHEPVSDATFGGEEIRIPLTEEVASVQKHAVVREEVHVGKREVTDVASLGDEVRHEELKIEDETKTPQLERTPSQVQ